MEGLIFSIVCAILYRLGGDGSGKLYRRIGVPLAIFLYHFLVYRSLYSFLIIPYGFSVMTLPVTLKGDDITKFWLNWAWLPVLGYLIGLINGSLLYALVYGIIFTIVVTLSNIKKTADIFKWDRVELFLGGSLGFLTYLVTNG